MLVCWSKTWVYCQFYLLARSKLKTSIRLLLQPFSSSYNSINSFLSFLWALLELWEQLKILHLHFELLAVIMQPHSSQPANINLWLSEWNFINIPLKLLIVMQFLLRCPLLSKRKRSSMSCQRYISLSSGLQSWWKQLLHCSVTKQISQQGSAALK